MAETLYRHKKRGTIYRILHRGKFQITIIYDGEYYGRNDLDDEPVIIYQDIDDPKKIWVRTEEEFFDGRFEQIEMTKEIWDSIEDQYV